MRIDPKDYREWNDRSWTLDDGYSSDLELSGSEKAGGFLFAKYFRSKRFKTREEAMEAFDSGILKLT